MPIISDSVSFITMSCDDGKILTSISIIVAFEQFDKVRSNTLLQIRLSHNEKGMIIESQFTLELSFVEKVIVTV